MYFGAKPMTTFASICMVVLREIRIANGYSLEALSDRLNIKSQEWHSMETGGRDLQFETFVRACHQLNTKPAQVICLSERYAEILAALGWDILYNRITKGNDNLLESAKGYWASPGGSGCFRDMPIWQDPTLIFNGPSLVAPVFRYALYPWYKDSQTISTLQLNLSPLGLSDGQTDADANTID
jgi:transcriptional regulator with XRE-family HTH domain